MKKPLIALVACILVMALSMGFASMVQTGFGDIDVSTWYIETEDGIIGYKLYIPAGVSADNPAPAVLLLHGYQNDKETNAAYSIELARRGIVAFSVDEYGHGSTTIPMRERGWTYYSGRDYTKSISGPTRFLTLSNFSTLDFFNDDISAGIKDSSMGGVIAYQFLQSFDFVDESRMGVTGHSMGTWSSWSVAAAFPDHRAIVLQCGEIFPLDYYDHDNIKFNNVMLIQAVYDEFDYFRDYQPNVYGLENTPLRYHDFMGQDAPVDWNTTYGSFADGTARRMELLVTNHRLVTHNGKGVAAAMDWFVTALDADTTLAATNHIYMLKEVLVLIGMLAALASMLPLLVLLTKTKFFAPVAQPLPDDPDKLLPKKSWWKNAVIMILISFATFPFMTQLGQGLLPVPESVFRMPIATGFMTWLTTLMIITLILLLVWYRRGQGKRLGVTLYDLGLAERGQPNKTSWGVVAKSVLLAVILVGVMYLFTVLSNTLFQLDFRFIWPFFKPFNSARLVQFFVYILFYVAYFLISGGVKLYGQMRRPQKKTAAGTQLAWWGNSVFLMLGGVLLVVLLEYIPFFLGLGPGADLLFGPTFGGPFMSIMILLIPQFIIFFFISTYMYRRTGHVYVGSLVVAMLACWVVTGGSAYF